MRLILLLVLFTQITFSQRKPVEIFVDYVDQIEYVTFQLHFDSISKLNNINLIKELTTLQDSLKIEEIKANIYASNYKTNFKDKSFKLSFRLINEDYKNLKISKEDKKLVQKYFKNGKFKDKIPWHKTIFTREENVQYSDYKDIHSEYSVEWYNDYSYTLTLIQKDVKEKLKIGDKLYIEILKVLDNKNYLFKCSIDGYTYHSILTNID